MLLNLCIMVRDGTIGRCSSQFIRSTENGSSYSLDVTRRELLIYVLLMYYVHSCVPKVRRCFLLVLQVTYAVQHSKGNTIQLTTGLPKNITTGWHAHMHKGEEGPKYSSEGTYITAPLWNVFSFSRQSFCYHTYCTSQR